MVFSWFWWFPRLYVHTTGWAKSWHTWAPPEQYLQFPQKILIFPKKLFNPKIVSIKFMMKKVVLIFGVRWPLLLKSAYVPQNFFSPICILIFIPPCLLCTLYLVVIFILSCTSVCQVPHCEATMGSHFQSKY